MGAGIEIYDEAGNVTLSIGDRPLKLLQVVPIGTTASGEVSSGFIAGDNNIVPILSGSGSGNYRNPSVTVNKTQGKVQWDYSGIASGNRDPNMKMIVQVF